MFFRPCLSPATSSAWSYHCFGYCAVRRTHWRSGWDAWRSSNCGAVITSLHHGPEWLHPVDVHQFVDLLANAMLNHFVIVSLKICVTLEVIRIDVWTWLHVLVNESLQGDFLGTRYDVDLDLIAVPILDSDDYGLADWSSTGLELLIFMLVAFLAADVGFIHFDRSAAEIGDILHSASRVRWAMNQATFWVMPKSRWSFMLEASFRLVVSNTFQSPTSEAENCWTAWPFRSWRWCTFHNFHIIRASASHPSPTLFKCWSSSWVSSVKHRRRLPAESHFPPYCEKIVVLLRLTDLSNLHTPLKETFSGLHVKYADRVNGLYDNWNDWSVWF